MSKDDDERLHNMVVYNMYLTDNERDEAAPAIGCMLLVSLVAIALIYNWSKITHFFASLLPGE